jgi:anti-sigma factor RsiW
MNHQQFEEWLFADQTLTPQEEAVLQEHLEGCESCRLLAASWREVERDLRQAPVVAPAPGFTLRWQARLEGQQRRLHRRQSVLLLGYSIAGVFLLLGSLVILLWPQLQSPGTIFYTWLYQTASLLVYLSYAGSVLSSIFRTAANIVPLVWWILMAGILSLLGVLWVVSVRMLTNPRRITK